MNQEQQELADVLIRLDNHFMMVDFKLSPERQKFIQEELDSGW